MLPLSSELNRNVCKRIPVWAPIEGNQVERRPGRFALAFRSEAPCAHCCAMSMVLPANILSSAPHISVRLATSVKILANARPKYQEKRAIFKYPEAGTFAAPQRTRSQKRLHQHWKAKVISRLVAGLCPHIASRRRVR